MESLSEWFRSNKLSLKVSKTNFVIFNHNKIDIPENLTMKIGNENIERKNSVKFLGMIIDSKLEWKEHISCVKNKISSGIYAINKVKHILNHRHLTTLYFSLIHPYLDYGISLWGSTHNTENIGIPILSDTDGLHITDNAKAEALNRQFVSVFTNDDGNSLPDKGPSPFPDMDDINFTQPGIEKLLDNIKPNKAAGPDELPARVLKEVSKEISGVLSMIFQQSYNAGRIPDDWSAARISAIYKKGDKSTPANYRPVSLTCILCKLMEHVVCSQMGSHLDNHDILHQNQHGFRKGLSCETQLVGTIQDWASSINSKGQTDVILLDFSKAFDNVSHRKLLHKIHHYGIRGKTKSWITAFLDSRQQQVVVNGRASNTADVLSGVPQGTVHQ